MPDREKVIKGIESCIKMGRLGVENCRELNCPYFENGLRLSCWIDVLTDALALLKEQYKLLCKKQKDVNKLQADYAELRHKFLEKTQIVRCKDCENKECWGRTGDIVCGINGTPHRPDWYCAYGERMKK